MTLQLGPLHELIIYVSDMQAQVEFYRDILGLKITYPAELNDYSE
ncbi:VOC family protein [Planctomycetaceae bacterium]|jgi:catechol 2,3-dioxygenase-like lactoylglutathione lyase family enzyme|nr:VOC family protein [bacterium]MDC0261673.1 VOC family protein [Planctomycetaceae bacterium]MDG2388377.1 VOC family protein [Planctomycetaceae bacterium]